MAKSNKNTHGNNNSVPMYCPPDENAIWKFSLSLQQVFWNFVDAIEDNICKDDLKFEKYTIDIVGEICVRVDKRALYFHIFHDVEMSEIRQAALIAYWVLKFHPIRLENEAIIKDVNSRFAVFIMLSAIQEYARKKIGEDYQLNLTEAYIRKLQYAAKYWDLSKEAMMLIAETIAEHVVTYKT